jgi:uncharacterized membrane protein
LVIGSVVFVLLLGAAMEGWLQIGLFIAITIVLAFIGEDLGVRTGVTFGAYQYSGLLGPKADLVPILVLVTYFTAGYVSLSIARILIGAGPRPRGARLLGLALAATFIMVGWDVAMDPQSSVLGGWWIWTKGGAYFGIPLHNFWGWFVLNFVIFVVYLLVRAHLSAADPAPESGKRELWTEPLIFWALYAATIFGPPMAEHHSTFSSLNVIKPPTGMTPDQIAWAIALIALFTMVGPVVFAAGRLGAGGDLPLKATAADQSPAGWGALVRDRALLVTALAIVVYVAGVYALGLQGGFVPLR